MTLFDKHALPCAITYAALRDALVRPDNLANETIERLIDRVIEAANKYDDGSGPAQAAQNHVLYTYARYLEMVLQERAQIRKQTNGAKHVRND